MSNAVLQQSAESTALNWVAVVAKKQKQKKAGKNFREVTNQREQRKGDQKGQKGSCNFIPVLCKCFVCAVFDNVKLVFLWFVRCRIDYFRCT